MERNYGRRGTQKFDEQLVAKPKTPMLYLDKWRKKSWIDHIYVSNKFLQDGTITGAGIDTGKITYKSDHRMVGVRVNFTTMVGRIEGMPKTQKTRHRTVKATIKKNKEAYRTIAQNREDKRDEKKGKKKGFKYWETELNKIKNKITRASTKKNKQKAQKK